MDIKILEMEKKRNSFVYLRKSWQTYKNKHPNIAQLITLFIVSNGVTLLQMILMPILIIHLSLTTVLFLFWSFFNF